MFDLRECETHAVELADGMRVCGNQKGKMVINQLNNTIGVRARIQADPDFREATD
ncbi:hypothetical protein PC116_g22007 [Phytophthora cactorum]|nr:hypothetical protein PC116_g22007 [Phytophthora cactorum]